MSYAAGDRLPPLSPPPVDRMRLAYMAVAMRDPNLVHIDDDYAERCGLPGVIAHGTFVVAYLGLVVSRAAGAGAVRRLRVELTAPVFPGDTVSAEGTVTGVVPHEDGQLVTATLTARRADGSTVGRGEATFYQAAEAGNGATP
jgi:acyl dehydratase